MFAPKKVVHHEDMRQHFFVVGYDNPQDLRKSFEVMIEILKNGNIISRKTAVAKRSFLPQQIQWAKREIAGWLLEGCRWEIVGMKLACESFVATSSPCLADEKAPNAIFEAAESIASEFAGKISRVVQYLAP